MPMYTSSVNPPSDPSNLVGQFPSIDKGCIKFLYPSLLEPYH